MKKYFIIALVFISSCQKKITDQIKTIDAKGEILFTSQRFPNNSDWQIILMNADGTNQRPVSGKAVDCSPPIVSNNKRKVAFTTYENLYRNLYVIDIDGQNLKLLDKARQTCSNPVWSPDDSKITYVRNDIGAAGSFDIYTINIDGTNRIQLTNQNDNYSPHYLPDNSAIIYTSLNGTISGVYKMHTDGNNKQLLSPPGRSFSVSSVSPDGKMIAINSQDWNGTQIFVMKLDGSGLKQLTFTIEKNYFDTGFPRGGNCNPVWSPNSTRLVYESYENTTPDIFIINSNGSGNKRLTDNPLRDEGPCWTNDGNYIIYSAGKIWYAGGSPTYGGSTICIMTPDGQLKTAVTDNKISDVYPNFISK